MIPLVVPHIDHAVTEWMDTRVRPHLNLPEVTPSPVEQKVETKKRVVVPGVGKIQDSSFSR
jgi:hypothetical protein